MEKNSDIRPASKREFQIFMAQGKKNQVINEHDLPVNSFCHPLQYTKKMNRKSRVHLIPMNYKFQRKFYDNYLELKK